MREILRWIMREIMREISRWILRGVLREIVKHANNRFDNNSFGLYFSSFVESKTGLNNEHMYITIKLQIFILYILLIKES